MAEIDSDPPSFRGTSPEECELFVSTIRRRALTQGKHRDNEWMAVFASSCFTGDVFYWYEGLEEDVQNDWRRLRPALVARFGRPLTTMPGASSTSVSAPFTLNPSLTTVPPTPGPPPLVRKGRLKVADSNGRRLGYLGRRAYPPSLYKRIYDPDESEDPLLVSFTVSALEEPFEIQIIDPSQSQQNNDMLAIGWYSTAKNEWLHDPKRVANCCSYEGKGIDFYWVRERKVWKISKDGELTVEYPRPDHGTESLKCYFLSYCIWFGRSNDFSTRPSRLIFEDIV